MASNYYQDYSAYESYADDATDSQSQSQPQTSQNPQSSLLPSLPPKQVASPNPISRNVSYSQNSYTNRDESTQISSPDVSQSNASPLNRSLGTQASRNTKKTSTSGTASTSNVVALTTNWWDTLVPSRWAGIYLGVILVETIVVVTMVSIVFGLIQSRVEDPKNQEIKTVPVYLAIFVFGMLFEVVFALDAARLKNTIQLIGVSIFNIALIITASLEITQVRDGIQAEVRQERQDGGTAPAAGLYSTVEKFLIVVPVIVGIAQFPIMIITWKLHQEFGWLIYKKLGADLKIRKMFMWYQIFVVLLKFTFFFGTGFSVAYLILIEDHDSWSFPVTIAAIPVAIAALVMAAVAAKKEIKWLMMFSILLFIAGLTYFAYQLSRMYSPSTAENYVTVKLTLTWFSIFSIASLILTTILALICFNNFNQGLKEAHIKSKSSTNTISRTRQVGMAMRNKRNSSNNQLSSPSQHGGSRFGKNPILEDEENELGVDESWGEMREVENTNGDRRGSNPMGIGINNGNGNASRLSLD